MTHSLTLGDLLLTETLPTPDGYVLNVLADGTTFGVAQSVQEVVTSLLADGDIVRTTRNGNREVTFSVEITGDSLVSVQAGEVALRREVGKPNILVWEAPDVVPVPTAFEVVDSSMEQVFDDLGELRRRRTFRVTLACSPFARSVDPVTIPALAPPASPTNISITNADTTAGFTAQRADFSVSPTVSSNPVTDEGAFVRTTGSGYWLRLRLIYTLTTAVTMTSTPYLVVQVGGSLNPGFLATFGGVEALRTPVLARALSDGTVLYAFDTGGQPVKTVTVGFDIKSSKLETRTVEIHDIYRTDTLPQVSTRQTARVLEVGGTERTPASIRVQAPNGTTPLGLTIIHTAPEDGSGYAPPLRRWRVSGNTVIPDATLLSGGREFIHTNAVQFEVPTSAMPEGAYLMCARLRSNTVGNHRVFFSGQTRLPAPNASTLMGPVATAETINFPVINEWVFASLGVLTLPTIRTAAGKVVIGIQRDAAISVNIEMDEAWLFRIDDDCALTVADIPAANMWADSPGLGYPVPTLWMGPDLASRVHPGSGLRAMGNHVLRADGTSVFAATVGVEYPNVSATFHRRWHSNAGD